MVWPCNDLPKQIITRCNQAAIASSGALASEVFDWIFTRPSNHPRHAEQHFVTESIPIQARGWLNFI